MIFLHRKGYVNLNAGKHSFKQRSLSKSYVNRYKMRKKEYYTKIYNSGNLSQRRIFYFS